MNLFRKSTKTESGSSDFFGLFTIIAIVVVLGIVGYGIYWMGSRGSADANKECIVYSGGTFEEREYKFILPAGSNNAQIGWGSDVYCYPNDQRDFTASNDTDADRGPVTFVTKDDVSMSTDVSAAFFLDTDPDTLPEFHRRLGVKHRAWTKDGWIAMLNKTLSPAVERSIETAAQDFTSDQLYSDSQARREFNQRIAELLQVALQENVGGDYFCGVGYVAGTECPPFKILVGRPVISNPEIVAAIEAETANRRRTAAQEEANRQTQAKLDIETEIIEQYGPNGALIWKAIESGKVTFYVLPDGTVTTVPAPPN